MLKETVSREFSIIFLNFFKRFDLGPIWTGKNCFIPNFFVFANIFDHKVRKSRVSVVNNNMDTSFFREYLRENRKFREKVFTCSYGAQVEFSFYIKRCRKSRDTVPLTICGPKTLKEQKNSAKQLLKVPIPVSFRFRLKYTGTVRYRYDSIPRQHHSFIVNENSYGQSSAKASNRFKQIRSFKTNCLPIKIKK